MQRVVAVALAAQSPELGGWAVVAAAETAEAAKADWVVAAAVAALLVPAAWVVAAAVAMVLVVRAAQGL